MDRSAGPADARVSRAEAIEQTEFAGVEGDQRSEWQENYIRECMDKKGFPEKATI